MKITVVSSTIFKVPLVNYGGLEAIAYEQAEGLAKKGHEVYLVAPEGSNCVHSKLLPIGPERTITERRAYDKYWEHLLEMDVVISNDWEKWSYILKMEGRLKAPILGVFHAPVNTMYQEMPPVPKPCLVCISEDQATHLKALHNIDSRVAYNGIDPEFYSSIGSPRTNRYLFLARFSAIKGADLAIKACLDSGVGLDLVGDTTITNEPEFLKQCMQLAEFESPGWDQSKGKQIRVIGPASRGETVFWFSQAYCLLHPNQRFREPLGLAPLEAQSCGCPVIAWRYGAMPETVSHRETGFLVRSYEEMVNLIKSDAPKAIDRKRCKEWATYFSLQKMVDRYESLCVEAIEQGGW